MDIELDVYLIPELPEPDPREVKLPAWARDLLIAYRSVNHRAIQQVESARAAAKEALLATNPTTALVYIDTDQGNDIGLPSGTIVFRDPAGPPDRWRFELRIRRTLDGWLEISGSEPLRIQPQASNVIRVRLAG